MTQFTTLQKKFIVETITLRYEQTFISWQDETSNVVYNFLKGTASIEDKWNVLIAYCDNFSNTSKRFYTILKDTLNDAISELSKTPILLEDTCLHPDIALFSEITQAKIIKDIKAFYNKHINDDRTLASLELLHLLNDETVLQSIKWLAVLAYFKNKNNHSLWFFKQIEFLIKNHDINIDHLHHANKHNQLGNYELALAELKHIHPKKPIIYIRMGELYTKIQNYGDAYDAYHQAVCLLEKQTTSEISQTEAIKHQEHALHRLIQSGQYIHYINQQDRYDQKSHYFHHFVQPLKKDIMKGGRPGAFMMILGLLGSDYVLPLALTVVGLGVTGLGMGVASIGGTVHGLFRTSTRRPIGIQKQNKMIERLQLLALQPDELKQSVINNIVREYEQHKNKVASTASLTLLNTLKSERTINEKLIAIENYMLTIKNNIYKNNGKKLFNIIDEILFIKLNAHEPPSRLSQL